MPGSDMTDMFVRVWDFYQSGKVAEARAEFNRYLPLIRYELQPGLGVSVMKHRLHAWRDHRLAAACAIRPVPSTKMDCESLKNCSDGLEYACFGLESIRDLELFSDQISGIA